MGRKQDRPGKYLPFYLAGLFFLIGFPTGCQNLRFAPLNPPPAKTLKIADQLLRDGDYSGAIFAAGEVLNCCREDQGDRALYLMGLALAHPDNPAADPAEALIRFERLTTDFPESRHAPEARAWSSTLSRVVRLQTQLEKGTERIQKLNRELDNRSRRINVLEKQIEQLKAVDLDVEANRRNEKEQAP